jgi:hypothetical protein
MRLIEADALKKTGMSVTIGGRPYVVVSLQAIDAAPTVDAEAVVRGKWNVRYLSGTHVQAGVVCSGCDCWSARGSKYCPNCGAKVDVELH